MIIYRVYSDKYEAEAMVTEENSILGLWSTNDAHWRNEYFSPFMNQLGIEVKTSGYPETFLEHVEELCKEWWGEI